MHFSSTMHYFHNNENHRNHRNKFNQDHQTCNQGERGAQERTVGQFKKSWRRQRAYVVFDDDDLVVLEDHVVKDDDNYVVLDEHVVIDDDIYVVFDHHFVSSVRSSNSHPDLLLIHHHPPTFSDHTGPQHWTFTF